VNASASFKPLTDALLARFGDSDEGLTTAVDLAVLVAMADQHIDEAEMAALVASIEGLLGTRLSVAVAKHLVTQSRAKARSAGAEARARAVGASLKFHDAAEEGLRLALAVAWASEGLAEAERALLAVVAGTAGVTGERLDALAAEMKPAG
jgi:tellurite resistance protein